MVEFFHPSPSDTDEITRVNRQVRGIAQHDPYLFWLCCTLYGERCLVARVASGDVVGYLLSIPAADPAAEFLLQVAVLKPWRTHMTGLKLLKRHWTWMVGCNIKR